jgi:menaquinone-dependent protoporphyrinogen IX oxidase
MRFNMRTLVIYRSISGFTRKYAEWIAQELNADIYDVRDFDAAMFSNYELVVFGGSLHAIGINGIKTIKKNFPHLKNKKIIIFAVGASSPRKHELEEIKSKNFTVEQRQNIAFYYLRGGFNYNKLDHLNKVVMTLFKIRIKLKKKRTTDEIGMLAAYSRPIDCTKKENITKIVEYAKSLAL